MNENEMFLSQNIVKKRLKSAYRMPNEIRMADEIAEVMDFCDKSGNRPPQRFSKMPVKHWKGIAAHGCYRIPSGRVEGVNDLIKSKRRQAYGYRDGKTPERVRLWMSCRDSISQQRIHAYATGSRPHSCRPGFARSGAEGYKSP